MALKYFKPIKTLKYIGLARCGKESDHAELTQIFRLPTEEGEGTFIFIYIIFCLLKLKLYCFIIIVFCFLL